jgi:hypothetical protein
VNVAQSLVTGTRERAARPLVSTWLVRGGLILNLSLALSYIGMWVMAAASDFFWRADFSAFYTGWAIVRDGHGPQLYDWGLQRIYQQQILAGRTFDGGLLPYVNPPHVTLLLTPLAFLPRQVAFIVWTAGQVALLAWLLSLIWRFTADWPRRERWLALLAIAAFPPLLNTFLLGTFSLIILVCVLQYYGALRENAGVKAAAWLALATLKPQLVVLPGLILLAARRWRALLWGALMVGVSVIVSSAALGWRIWPGFIGAMGEHMRLFGVNGVEPSAMYNFRGLLTTLWGNARANEINLVSNVVLALTIIAALWLWRGPWRPAEPIFELRFALTVMLGVLFCVHLYPHDALLVVAPAVLFYDYLRRRDLPRRGYATFVLCCPAAFMLSQFVLGNQLPFRLPVVLIAALTTWMAVALRADRSCPALPA